MSRQIKSQIDVSRPVEKSITTTSPIKFHGDVNFTLDTEFVGLLKTPKIVFDKLSVDKSEFVNSFP
jgi:hypothetical protein